MAQVEAAEMDNTVQVNPMMIAVTA